MGKFCLLIVIACVMLASLNFAAYAAHKRVVVEGLDSSRVFNATVQYVFQTQDWFGYDGKGTAYTGEDGTVNITLYDSVPQNNEKWEMWFMAAYGNVSSDWVRCDYTGTSNYKDCPISLPVYELRVYVRDRNENPLQGIPVSIDAGLAYTDSGGQVKIYAKPGVHDVKVQYGEISEQQTIDLEKSQTLAMELDLNDLIITVKDDKGVPLDNAVVIIRDMEFTPDQNGIVKIGKFDSYTAQVSVKYKGVEKTATVDVASSPNYTFLFDINPPVIQNVQVSEDKNILVSADVQDQNQFGSGMGVGAVVELDYAIDGKWSAQEMFRSGATEYQATIPLQLAGTEIQYKVRAKDVDGNWNETQVYTYTENNSGSGIVVKPPSGQNGTAGNSGTANGNGGRSLQLPSIGFSLNVDAGNPLCIGGIALVAILAVVVFLRRRKEDREDEELTPMEEKPEEKK